MMIVELIDEVDFKEKLIGIGAPIEPNDTLDEVSAKLSIWVEESSQQLELVQTACNELEATGATILPEVHELIKAFLRR